MRVRAVDAALVKDWTEWLRAGLKLFGASGHGDWSRSVTVDDVQTAIDSKDVLFVRAIEEGPVRGLAIVLHARWEERVIGRPFAKVHVLAADNYAIAVALARAVIDACAASGVVLVSATPGHSPIFIHAALAEAGFHVASQALTVRADLDAIAPALARIPLRGRFRLATPADGDAIVDIASRAFVKSRFMSDPLFRLEWGSQLMGAWARNLVNGGAEEILVADSSHGLIGFATMASAAFRGPRVPELTAAEPRYDGAGIGAMLLRQMFEWHRARGLKVFTGVTEKSNTAINALYARLGFTVLDSNLVYHASPALTPNS